MKYDDYALLETQKLPENTGFYHPEKQPEIAHLDSPALDVFTDFKSKPPACISPHENVQSALEHMKTEGVKSLLVVNEEEMIIGLVSARGVQGARLGMIAQKHAVNLTDVTVYMAMMPAEDLSTLNFKYLDSARVGHIVRLMHDKGVNYLLALEEIADQQIVRGIFSASRISRQLDELVLGDFSSSNLADMNRRI